MPAQTIRIKRRLSGSAGAPSTLASAELAYNNVDGTLYIGAGDNGSGTATSVVAIAGTNAVGNFVTLDTTQTITGDKNFGGSVAFGGEVDFRLAQIQGIKLWHLDDVDASLGEAPPTAGDILTWNGSEWTASPAPADSIVSVVAAPDSGVYATTSGDVVTIGGIDATTSVKGVVRFATSQEVTDGAAGVVVSAADLKGSLYELPVATATVLGGIKVGDHLAITPDGVLSVNMPGALTYRGAADVTQPAPVDPQQGDVYIAEPGGTAHSTWTGIAGDNILDNALLLYNGSEWDAADLAVETGVMDVNGTDPITVDKTNPKQPVIGVKDATTEQKGVVELADATDLANGATDKVVTADQVQEIAGAVLPIGTSDGAVLTYAQASSQWVSQDYLDGGVF
jgi:hypothetical protein